MSAAEPLRKPRRVAEPCAMSAPLEVSIGLRQQRKLCGLVQKFLACKVQCKRRRASVACLVIGILQSCLALHELEKRQDADTNQCGEKRD